MAYAESGLRAVLCRETLTALGPSFIKAGQVLASRPDIIREDYMNELCTLQVCVGCVAGGNGMANTVPSSDTST